ncbi:hypothetical protein J7K93_04765 [bacterium]|nr:hypothetical protein [bacterium]
MNPLRNPPAHIPAIRKIVYILLILILLSGLYGYPNNKKEIFQIQGKGLYSPFEGKTVFLKKNIVTGIAKNGFFMQTPITRSDNNPATSDGIFVYTKYKPKVKVGDIVDIKGKVKEFHKLTEISLIGKIIKKGHTKKLPPCFKLPELINRKQFLERFEGMRVSSSELFICGPSDRYGEAFISLSGKRAFREPGILFPGQRGFPVWDGNPEVIKIDPDGIGGKKQRFFSGVKIDAVKGIMTFSYGQYKILPKFIALGKKPTPHRAREKNRNEITIGTFNLKRMFDTIDDNTTIDAVLSRKTYRLMIKKRALFILKTMNLPDILAVEEVENKQVLKDIAEQIKKLSPETSYKCFLKNGNDPSGMDVGFLTDKNIIVDSVIQYCKNKKFNWGQKHSLLHDRPPLAIFCHIKNRADIPIVVIAVHLRSLYGIDGPDSLRIRKKRFLQSVSIAKLIQKLQTSDKNLKIVVAGDFNSFQFTDGYADILGEISGRQQKSGSFFHAKSPVTPPLFDTIFKAAENERYSFIYQGNSACFDHILVSQNLKKSVSDIVFCRGNCDTPEYFSRIKDSPLRSSDHDGVVLYLSYKKLRVMK